LQPVSSVKPISRYRYRLICSGMWDAYALARAARLAGFAVAEAFAFGAAFFADACGAAFEADVFDAGML
jgi:hypothetical protein